MGLTAEQRARAKEMGLEVAEPMRPQERAKMPLPTLPEGLELAEPEPTPPAPYVDRPISPNRLSALGKTPPRFEYHPMREDGSGRSSIGYDRNGNEIHDARGEDLAEEAPIAGFVQGVSAGTYPRLAAYADTAADRLGLMRGVGAQMVPREWGWDTNHMSADNWRRAEEERQAQVEEHGPLAYRAGEALGYVPGMLVPFGEAAEGAGMLARVAAAAEAGGGYGAANAWGRAHGSVGNQAIDTLLGGAAGAVGGAGADLGGQAVSHVIGPVMEAGASKLGELADTAAARRVIGFGTAARHRIEDLAQRYGGSAANDIAAGVRNFGRSVRGLGLSGSSLAEATEAQGRIGRRLGGIRDEAARSLPPEPGRMIPAPPGSVARRSDIVDELNDLARSRATGEPSLQGEAEQRVLGRYARAHADPARSPDLSMDDLEAMKAKFDEDADWDGATDAEAPARVAAARDASRAVARRMQQVVSDAAGLSGDTSLMPRYAQARGDYGTASRVARWARRDATAAPTIYQPRRLLEEVRPRAAAAVTQAVASGGESLLRAPATMSAKLQRLLSRPGEPLGRFTGPLRAALARGGQEAMTTLHHRLMQTEPEVREMMDRIDNEER